MAGFADIFTFKTLVFLLTLVISSIPLLFIVRFLGGRASIIKILFANILVAVLGALVFSYFGILEGVWSYVIAFGVLLIVYSIMFEISIIKAFLAWLLQGAILFILRQLIPL